MSVFWKTLTLIINDGSFVLTVLFVVCFACVLAFVFGAAGELIASIVMLGCLTATAEFVMHHRNGR